VAHGISYGRTGLALLYA